MNYKVGDFVKCTNSDNFIAIILNIDIKKYRITFYVIESVPYSMSDMEFDLIFDDFQEMNEFYNEDYNIITDEKEISRLNKIMIFK